MKDGSETRTDQDSASGPPDSANTLARLSVDERDEIIRRMKRVEAFFHDTFEIDIYLTWGTLLGAVRSGGFISFDNDVDLAYLSPMPTDHEILEEHDVIRHVLYENDMIVTLNSKGQIHIAAEGASAIEQQDKHSLDLWTTWVRNGRYFHYPDIQGDLPADVILPLRRLSLYGEEFWVPNKAEAVLEEFYGPDWRTPDPNYAWYPKRDQADPFEFLRHESRDVQIPAYPRRVAGLTSEKDGDVFVIRAPNVKMPVRINATAMLILEFCNGKNSPDDIIDLVQAAYNMETRPSVVVRQFLSEACDEGYIA
jgi:hypothetical protein